MHRQSSFRCSLTGLYSRRYFSARLARDIELAQADHRPLALAMVDPDHSSRINREHGQATGDRVLIAFADVARGIARPSDWVARYSGGDFAVVMPDTDAHGALRVMEGIRQAFASTVVYDDDGQAVPATLSAGIAELQPGMTDPMELWHQAMRAKIKAKFSGRNRVELG